MRATSNEQQRRQEGFTLELTVIGAVSIGVRIHVGTNCNRSHAGGSSGNCGDGGGYDDGIQT